MASSGSLLEMQILRLEPHPAKYQSAFQGHSPGDFMYFTGENYYSK